MKRKQVWRFYCEFCKKSGCSGGVIAKHEKSCTMNPNRVCGMCAADPDRLPKEYPTVAALIEAAKLDAVGELVTSDYEWKPYAVTNLEAVSLGCPACMLAGIRQSGIDLCWFDFDFTASKKLFWTRVNRHYDE